MTTPERYAEKVRDAEQALTYRLAEWGVRDADEKARGLVQEFLRAGWKPWAPVTALPTRDGTRPVPPPPTFTSARAALRAARPQDTQTAEEAPNG